MDIAEGMITHSANANTEFLQTVLGLNNIRKMIASLGLNETQDSYLVSSQLAMLNIYQQSREDWLERLRNLKFEDFLQMNLVINDFLVRETAEASEMLNEGYKDLLDPECLAIHVKFLPYSTTNEYSRVLERITKEEFKQFNKEFYRIFFEVIGISTMASKVAQTQFEHAGFKGGSSALQEDKNCMLTLAYFDQFKPQYARGMYRSLGLFMEDLDYELEYSRLIG